MMHEKISPHHLERKAILYVRQSSAHQVLHNRESGALQYAIRDRLTALGWSCVETVDDDLGRSAAGGVARAGFDRMVAEVCLGKVGAVAAREVPRFARNSSWISINCVHRSGSAEPYTQHRGPCLGGRGRHARGHRRAMGRRSRRGGRLSKHRDPTSRRNKAPTVGRDRDRPPWGGHPDRRRPADPAQPTRGVADRTAGFELGERIRLGRNTFTTVGLTLDMMASSGDPVVFVTLRDAQRLQFALEPAAAQQESARRPDAVGNTDTVNAILMRLHPGVDPKQFARTIARWRHLVALSQQEQETVLAQSVIERERRQIGLFTSLLLVVSTVIIGLIIGGETVYDDRWLRSDLRRLRLEAIGFIFQSHNLLPFLNAWENVAIACILAGRSATAARHRAEELLAYLEVDRRKDAMPSQLSGGEAQRVAIARALANDQLGNDRSELRRHGLSARRGDLHHALRLSGQIA